MVKIKPELFHISMNVLYGREAQTDKIVEELIELKVALRTRDRAKILDELADVQNVLPYLQVIYLRGEKYEIKYSGEHRYDFACDTLIRLIHSYKITSSHSCYRALAGYTQHFCECLYNIYADYSFSTNEVHDVISMKRSRTIERKIKEILHV